MNDWITDSQAHQSPTSGFALHAELRSGCACARVAGGIQSVFLRVLISLVKPRAFHLFTLI